MAEVGPTHGFESAFTLATSQSSCRLVVSFRPVCDPNSENEHIPLRKEDIN